VEAKMKGRGGDLKIREKLQAAGGTFLRTKLIRNEAYADGELTPNIRLNSADKTREVQEMLDELENQAEAWRHEYVQVEDGEGVQPAVVFARKDSLQILRDRGILAMMDSTHCTVHLRW